MGAAQDPRVPDPCARRRARRHRGDRLPPDPAARRLPARGRGAGKRRGAPAFGSIALALAMVGRLPVAAVGVLFGYLILFEGVIAGFRPSIQDRLLVRAAGVIVGQQPIYDTSREAVLQATGQPPILLGLTEASVVLTVYVVALLVVALFVFRARDVSCPAVYSVPSRRPPLTCGFPARRTT